MSILGLGRAGYSYLVIGAIAIAVYGLLGPGLLADLLFITTSASATAMVAVGIRRWRPAARGGWIAIGVTLGLLAAANVVALLSRLGLPDIRAIADVLFLVAYLPLFAGGFFFARGMHRSDRTILLDTAIVALAAIPIVWELVIEPQVSAGEGPAGMMATSLPVIDILLVSFVAPLLLLRASRSPSAVLVVLAFAVMGVGDSLYAVVSLGATLANPALMSLAWLSTYVLLGAAALAPSSKDLGGVRDAHAGAGDLARLFIVAVALLVSPLVVIRHEAAGGDPKLVIFAVLSLVMAVMLVLRLQRTVSQLASVDRRFRRFMSNDAILALIKDSAGRYVYMNPPVERLMLAPDAEWYGRTDPDLFRPDLAVHGRDSDAVVRRTGETIVATLAVDERVWQTARFPIPGTSGDVGVLGFDMTDRLAAEEAVRFQARLLASVRDVVIVWDLERKVTYWNRGAEQVLGFSGAEMLGRPLDLLIAGGEGKGMDVAWAAIVAGAVREVDWEAVGRDERHVWLNIRVSPLVSDDGEVTGYLGVANDVTARKDAARSADRVARERVLIAETLTALRAGQAPEETAQAVARRIVKLPEVALASVVTFGIDGHATVLGQADRGGGGMTDVVLPRTRGSYLQQRAAAGPWVESWNPDESHPYFDMLNDLGIMAHAYSPIVVDGRPIGLLIAGSDAADAVERMTERLPALQEFAAITGTLLGGTVASQMVEAARTAELQAVIATGAFHPVFQPIVELATSKVHGYEGLTRFADGTPPDVRFAEASRLRVGLALEQACLGAMFAAARSLPERLWLNVNVSPELVLAGLVEGLLPAGSRRIVLEVTEHDVITDYASFRAAVEAIRHRVEIAVDDAGAGFASLRHVVELQPAMVKLDRSLVVGIADDKGRQAVVAGMVRFAQAAGMLLIAEGIETDDELAALRRLGVPFGQGYLLGMPEPMQSTMPEPIRLAAPTRFTRTRPASRGALAPSGLPPILAAAAASRGPRR